MKAWEDFLKNLEGELGSSTIDNWLRPLNLLHFDACNIYLEAKDSFQALWFEEHIRQKVNKGLFNNNYKRIKVHLTIADPSSKKQNNKTDSKKKSKKGHSKSDTPTFEIQFEDLDPFCTFNNFVTSDGNPLSLKLFTKLSAELGARQGISSDSPLAGFNPIYLHGGTGLGKTHLLMATAHELRKKGLKVIYSRTNTFTEHVVSAIRAGEMQRFRQAYRNVDVLIIDDVHILSRKNSTQEEFFHTFNTLHLEGKQIILSANCSSQELKYVEPRLISRFYWGIVISVSPLSTNEMRQILENKATFMQFFLKDNVKEFLIQIFSSSPKALCQALEALVLRFHLDGNSKPSDSPELEAVKYYLEDLISEEERSALTANKIIQSVSERYGIRVEDILGSIQSREYSFPRQLAMFMCRTYLKLPFMKIGDLFSRDHSTVMTSVKQIQKQIKDKNRDVTGTLLALENQLQITR